MEVEDVYGYLAERIKISLNDEIENIKLYDHYILVSDYIPISLK